MKPPICVDLWWPGNKMVIGSYTLGSMFKSSFSLPKINLHALIPRILFPLAVLAASSCGVIPLWSNANIHEIDNDKDRKAGQHSAADRPSGSLVASEDIPWEFNSKCRKLLTRKDIEDTANTNGPFDIRKLKENCSEQNSEEDTTFLGIAVSGGGSRAAVFSAEVFFELQRYGILEQVDVISSVSGGSYTSAFYALSCDDYGDEKQVEKYCPRTVEDPDRFIWKPEQVFPLLQKNYIARWIWNWFWPDNIVRYWLTNFDRTDIMAETLSDNLYDNSNWGNEGFRFHDLNPKRPHLIVNATNNTSTVHRTLSKDICNASRESIRCEARTQCLNFTFTLETFQCLKSSLDQYPVANAVTASATFPGAFNYMTLGTYRGCKNSDCDTDPVGYLHLFDGGTSDNLGLFALNRVLKSVPDSAGGGRVNKVVILIDAFVPPVGKKQDKSEPRSGLDYFVDTNFLDAYDTLMEKLRKLQKKETRELLKGNKAPKLNKNNLIELNIEDVGKYSKNLGAYVNKIKTSLKIDDLDALCLRLAARILIHGTIGKIRSSHPYLNVPDNPSKDPRLRQRKLEVEEGVELKEEHCVRIEETPVREEISP